jgi:pimeloyl-ACP methyl ester carboxylesterase
VTLSVLRFAASTVAPVTKMVKAGQVEASIERFARGVLGSQAFEQLPEDVRAHMHANARTHVGQTLADGGFEPITEQDIASVQTPALVVTGANSPAFFRRLAALLAGLLPNSQTLDVPAASHAMHLQNPQAVNAGLLSFLHAVSATESKEPNDG